MGHEFAGEAGKGGAAGACGAVMQRLWVQLGRVGGEIEDGLIERSEHVQRLFAQFVDSRYGVAGVDELWSVLGWIEFTNLEPFTAYLR